MLQYSPEDPFGGLLSSSTSSETRVSLSQWLISQRASPYHIPMDSPDGPISGWRFHSSASLESTSSSTISPGKLEPLRYSPSKPSYQRQRNASRTRRIGTWFKSRFNIMKRIGKRVDPPIFEIVRLEQSSNGLEGLITEVTDIIQWYDTESFLDPGAPDEFVYEAESPGVQDDVVTEKAKTKAQKIRSITSVLAQPSNSVESLRIEEEAGAFEKVVQWRGTLDQSDPGVQAEEEVGEKEKMLHKDNLYPVPPVPPIDLREEEESSHTSGINVTTIRRALSGEGSQMEYRAGSKRIQDLLGANFHYHDDEASVHSLMDVLQSELDSTAELEVLDPDLNRSAYRKRCLQALRHVSTRHQILPSSLMIQDVKRDGQNPVAGGGFADIWRGTVGDQPVCLKVLRLVIEPDEKVRSKIRKQFSNEALLWRQLKHPNILPLLGVNAELFSPSFCLISPWMENKDIITYLKGNPTHNRHNVLLEIAAGLSYLHSRDPPIIHADIRGANILVTDDFHCCLADFGLALITADSQSWSTATTSTMKGAIRWMAPELIVQGRGLSVKSSLHQTSRDIYAFGCTVVEILTLRLPFHEQRNDAAVLYSLLNHERPTRPKSVWCSDAIWKLTTRCWAGHAAARPQAREVYEVLQQSLS